MEQIKNINPSKVFEAPTGDIKALNEKRHLSKIHALKFSCSKLEAAFEFLIKLKLSDLPNLNFVTFEVTDIADGDEEVFLTSLKTLYKMEKRPLLISIINDMLIKIDNSFRYFHYKIERGEAECIEESLDKDEIIQEIISSKKFTINFVLYALIELDLSILDVTLNQLCEYFGEYYEKILVYAINAKDELCVQFLNLFVLIKAKGDENTNPFDTTIDKESQNLLSLAVEHRNIALIEIIINLLNEFYAISFYPFWKCALELAFEREFFDIYKILRKKYELIFLTDLEEKEMENDLNTEFDSILQEVEALHEVIESGGMPSQIKNFRNKYPNFKLCYINCLSALEKSIEVKKFEMYGILRAEGFCSIYAEVIIKKYNVTI